MCFQGIQQIKRKLYLPNVADPVQNIEDVAGINKIDVNLLSNGDMSEALVPHRGKYVFINLENINSDEIRSVKLSSHDQIIAKLYNQLSSQYSQIVVVFTGKSNEHQRRFAREIYSLEVNDAEATNTTNTTKASSNPGIFWKGERFLLYYTALSTEYANQSINIESMAVNATDQELIVTLSRNDVGSNDTDYLEFTVYRAKGYWYAKNFTWNEEELMPNRRISAVDNFSFHCTPAIYLVTVTSDRTVKIIWKGLQLQPKFGSIGVFESFGDAWDCVGFVNPVGLAATLIAIVLLFILLIGFMCMLNIKTNDRFDDPKKVITFGTN